MINKEFIIEEVCREIYDDACYYGDDPSPIRDIDQECQSYYGDPAFSSAHDYWSYILGWDKNDWNDIKYS